MRYLFVTFTLLLLSSMAFSQAPANDDCSNAISAFVGQTNFNTTTATDGSGLALDPMVCDMGPLGDEQVYQDIWFTFTAPTTEPYSITIIEGTCSGVFNSRLAVYDSPSCPDDPANVIACDDDSGHLTQAQICFVQFVAGSTYLIRVGSFGPSTIELPATLLIGTDCSPQATNPCVGMPDTCTPPPLGLALWLPFEETSGTTAKNLVGGNDGMHVSGPTPVSGKVGGALHMGGTASVSVPGYPALDVGTGDFSIDAWVKRDSSGAISNNIVEKIDSLAGYSFQLVSGFLTVTLKASTGGTRYLPVTPPVPMDGDWHFVAMTVDRDATNGGRLYLDGVLIGTFDPTAESGSLDTAAPLIVGPLSGAIDEVEVFSSALSASDVMALFVAGPAGKCRESCSLPWDAPLCATDMSITVNAQICNRTSSPQTYTYSFAGLPTGPGCTIPGPTSFTPGSTSLALAPGECKLLAVTIVRPAGLTLKMVSCYEMTVTSSSGSIFTCRGSVQDRSDLCPIGHPGELMLDLLEGAVVGPVLVSSPPAPGLLIPYRAIVFDDSMQSDARYVSLDGLPPGTAVTGLLDMSLGTDSISFTAEFVLPTALRSFSVVIETDADGDTVFVPLASFNMMNLLGGTVNIPRGEFCNGDGGDQMGCTDCPCANNAGPGTIGGCLNSAGTATRIYATGDPSTSLPGGPGATTDLRFNLDGAPSGAFCVLLSGSAVAPQNMANVCFGLDSGAQSVDRDGLRCAVMNLKRHGGRSANMLGVINDSAGPSRVWGGEAQPHGGIYTQGGFAAGETRYFQVTHRENPTLGCMRGLNTSQAIEVTFTP